MARLYPDTKFLRARAAALGFASTNSATQTRTSNVQKPLRSSLHNLDDDDLYDEEDEEEENEDEVIEDEDGVDLDMLPTMLVYRDGELVHNWVRVDWEVGQAGIEELLDRLVLFALHHLTENFKHLTLDITYCLILIQQYPQILACLATTTTTILISYGATMKIRHSLLGYYFSGYPPTGF